MPECRPADEHVERRSRSVEYKTRLARRSVARNVRLLDPAPTEKLPTDAALDECKKRESRKG